MKRYHAVALFKTGPLSEDAKLIMTGLIHLRIVCLEERRREQGI